LTNGTNSLMQLSTEPEMRGRVMAIRVAVALGGTPLGAPVVGWVADHFGPRWALAVGAASGVAAAIVAASYLMREKAAHRRICDLSPGTKSETLPRERRKRPSKSGQSKQCGETSLTTSPSQIGWSRSTRRHERSTTEQQ